MTTFTNSQLTALTFAQQHDWGQDAELREHRGEVYLTNLVDRYTIGGALFEDTVAVPATLADARAFGGY